MSLAEAADLLKVPRPFAPHGDLNNSTGPDAVELSPAQITAKVERDPVEWNARIQALRNAALSVMEIVEKRDVQGAVGRRRDLDQSCEACHRSYWYPGENAQFYQRLRNRLDGFSKARADGGPARAPNKQETHMRIGSGRWCCSRAVILLACRGRGTGDVGAARAAAAADAAANASRTSSGTSRR